MAGDLHMMLSPKKGNLLPVEGLNNVLPLGGVWVYTKDCNHPVFPKKWRKCLLSDKADIYHSDRTIMDDDGKSNGRLGKKCASMIGRRSLC